MPVNLQVKSISVVDAFVLRSEAIDGISISGPIPDTLTIECGFDPQVVNVNINVDIIVDVAKITASIAASWIGARLTRLHPQVQLEADRQKITIEPESITKYIKQASGREYE